MTSVKPGSQGEQTGTCKCEQWQLHSTSQWGQTMLLSEHVNCVAITFKVTEWVEQWIYIKVFVKLEHSSTQTIRMIQKATAMGNWWLAASLWQCSCSRITSHAEFLVKHQITQVTQPHCSPDLVPCNFCLFQKLKSPLKGKRFQIFDEVQENTMGAADGDWENCVTSQGAYFEGDWGIIVLCAMYLVSSLINVSIFHITWLDTFWTDLVYCDTTNYSCLWEWK